MLRNVVVGLALAIVLGIVPRVEGQELPSLGKLEAFDTPNDAGGSITLTWPRLNGLSETAVYEAYVSESADGPFFLVAEISPAGNFMAEKPAQFGYGADLERTHFAPVAEYERADGIVTIDSEKTYYLRLDLRDGDQISRGDVVSASAMGNFFNWSKLNNFILGSVFSLLILGYISLARRKELYIRRIGGLEALDEALGRATEMGKSVLYIHGLRDMSQISTIAAVNILGRVAKRTAEYDTALRVVAPDPVVMSVSQETVQTSYFEAGRPDAFNPDHVFVAGTEQFSYAAAVEGIMVREKPAAHIMMGYFYAESLLLAETGATTGAIQIAGTDSFTQLPFFVTTCDYTLMGEELYAASAYLSREPKLLGSLKGQDVGKAILIVVILLGVLLATVDVPFLTHVFTPH
ncbi:MAG: DUF6754 domain-containing protein [Candidatus Latescibacterota bacterium]|jgi:hypothetical protein